MQKSFHNVFKFLDWKLDIQKHQLILNYHVESIGQVTETLRFPVFHIIKERKHSIEKACELIHLMCGVSYYKAGLAPQIEFENYIPSQQMAAFVSKTWFHGLAELAYVNKVSLKDRITFSSSIDGVRAFDFQKNNYNHSQKQKKKSNAQTPSIIDKRVLPPLKSRTLVPLGGGKDSLVTIEELKQQAKEISLFMVGQSALIKNVARYIDLPLIQVQRNIDQKLIDYNKRGNGFNGHIPITAINSSLAVLTALLFDFDAIAFSNERSSDSANTHNADGEKVNHQYSKSFTFEKDISAIIHNEITSSLKYYSQQRAFSELAILKKFSHYPQYFSEFSSCNRNFHISGSQNSQGKWCCDCPKCRFVFLGLAAFITKSQLLKIFSKNMLDDDTQKHGFAELLGLKGFKPFECVGEIEESQLAFDLIKDAPQWRDDSLVQYFTNKCPQISNHQKNIIMQPML